MNVEQLHIVIIEVDKWFDESGIVPKLQSLASHLQNVVNQPQEPQHQQNVSNELADIRITLSQSRLDSFPISWKQILQNLSLGSLFERDLLTKIDSALTGNEITPSLALEAIQKISTGLTNHSQQIKTLIATFNYFKIGGGETLGDKCEISVSFPNTYFHGRLKDFAKIVTEMDGVIRLYNELETGSREEPVLASLSSTDPTIYTLVTLGVGLLLARTVTGFLSVYESLLRIKKLKLEVEKSDLSKGTISSLEKDMAKKIDEVVENETKSLLKTRFKKIDAGRKNELEAELKVRLKTVAKWLESGVTIAARAEEDDEVTEEHQDAKTIAHNKLALEIKGENEKLISSNIMGQQIFLLSDEEPADGDSEENGGEDE